MWFIFALFSALFASLTSLCYYKALQIEEVSKVVSIDKFSVIISMVLAFIILKEAVEIKTIIGGIFITIGTFVLIF